MNIDTPQFANSLNLGFASASLKNNAKQPPDPHKEPYSVSITHSTIPHSTGVKILSSIFSLVIIYSVLFPIIEIGASYVRKALFRFYAKPKDLPNNLIRSENLSEKSSISVPETISLFNKGELTLNQAKLLLKRASGLSAADVDFLLEEKKLTDS